MPAPPTGTWSGLDVLPPDVARKDVAAAMAITLLEPELRSRSRQRQNPRMSWACFREHEDAHCDRRSGVHVLRTGSRPHPSRRLCRQTLPNEPIGRSPSGVLQRASLTP
jgi:hypothetical protein